MTELDRKLRRNEIQIGITKLKDDIKKINRQISDLQSELGELDKPLIFHHAFQPQVTSINGGIIPLGGKCVLVVTAYTDREIHKTVTNILRYEKEDLYLDLTKNDINFIANNFIRYDEDNLKKYIKPEDYKIIEALLIVKEFRK